MSSEYEMSEEVRSLEQQLDCATEYCRQFSLEIKKLKERVEELERQLTAHQEREQWIHDNAKTSGGGRGFTVTFFVPVDHEDIFCGIDAAIASIQEWK
jgi:Tfp pilus assembly protein PilO